jgi:hypothetical protein
MGFICEFENPDGINDSVRVRVRRKSMNRERYLLFFGKPLG